MAHLSEGVLLGSGDLLGKGEGMASWGTTVTNSCMSEYEVTLNGNTLTV